MICALYVIGSTAGLILLTIRLSAAREELDRVRGESGDRDQAVRDECSAYAHGVTMALACLLAGLAASWYAPPRASARPAGSGGAGARSEAAAGGRGKG